ncbi:carbohydrate kinase family protein [Salinibaculum rarum]|uniref:carbohydrate kinase family protein n=1 Tax=Salinibaculum rarum TaxID=3058903 RepID=UPI00265F22CA|nr:PfkB family carbohydrate kinase [Salinibaculum sp. KK48]
MRVLCAGHVNWDVTLRVNALPAPDGEAAIDDQRQAGGGSAANTAAGLVGLGLDTALVGSVGDDENGLLARRELSALGVDCDSVVTVSGGETTVKYLVVDDDGQVIVLANEGVNESFTADAVTDARLRATDHLHLTGQATETAATLASRAVDAGLSVSLDPGRRVCDRDYSAAATHAEYLFVNGRELECATASGLTDRATVTVYKRGDSGAELRGEEPQSHPGYDIEPVDTAGAGDAFAAGFLASVLDGDDAGEALAVGNACGALACRDIGSRTDLSWEAIERFRARY